MQDDNAQRESQATHEDDDSQLLYSESRKRAGLGCPRDDDAQQVAQALDAKDPEETDDEATQDERDQPSQFARLQSPSRVSTPEKEATARKEEEAAALQQPVREEGGPSSEEREEGSAPPSPILMMTAVSSLLPAEAAKAVGAQHACSPPHLASPPPPPPHLPLFPAPPPCFLAPTSCGSELKHDDPEHAGAQVSGKETGDDETGVGKKRSARPAQANQQDLRQESHEPPSK